MKEIIEALIDAGFSQDEAEKAIAMIMDEED